LSGLPDKREGIHCLAASSDFEVKVWSRRPAGGSRQADYFRAEDSVARRHVQSRCVAVYGLEIAAMVDHDVLAVDIVNASDADNARPGRANI
jgi:hypothetical protein